MSAEFRRLELRLIKSLLDGGERQGVIGNTVRSGLKHLPSAMYWSPLGHWGVRDVASVDAYFRRTHDLRALDRRSVRADDPEPQFVTLGSGIDPHLPPAPRNLLTSAVLTLEPEEEQYLSDRIAASARGSMLGWLVHHQPSNDPDRVWDIDNLADAPKNLRNMVDHSKRYSLAINGAAILYNLLLAEKLLHDIASGDLQEVFDADTMFSEFFTDEHQALLASRRFGLVVPQQSLRKTLQGVFKKTPGLSPEMVLSPFDVGGATERFDLLIVDEAHRLNQRANQPSAMQNLRFAEVNERLFGRDDARYTQLDWIRAQSRRQIFLLDRLQSIKPADLSQEAQRCPVDEASRARRQYALTSQMRVRAGSDYVGYVRSALSNEPPAIPESFEPYDLRFFDDIGAMAAEIQARNDEHGLARLVAGYAWPWVTKKNPTAIEIGGHGFRRNNVATDWINSARSADEVGSIHTVQGYDLNFAGVIIGPDLRYDQAERRIAFDRANYHDKKGKENNPQLGITYSDEDLFAFVANIYGVLLTRGIRATYVYVCDPALRERLRPYFVPEVSLTSPLEVTGSPVLF